jgi:hypothetical protein
MAANIPTQTVNIGKPWKMECLAFPPQFKDKVLAIVGLNGVKEFKTSEDLIILLSPYSVQVEQEKNLEHLQPMLPVLLSHAKKNHLHVYVSNPHSKQSLPHTEAGKLWIRFWSAPQVEEHNTEIPRAFGIELEHDQRDAVKPNIQGVPIVDSEEVTVAEVVGSTLYVFFDLPHGNHAAELLKAILDEYDFMKLPLEEQARIRNQKMDELEQKACAEYAAACKERFEKYHQDVLEKLAETRAEQSKFSQALTKAIRQEFVLSQQLEFLAELSKDAEVRHAEEYKKLRVNPKVARLIVKGNKIIVQTVPLITAPTASGLRYSLGQYLVAIPFDGGTPTTTNLTRTVDNMHHPFDTGNGQLCYGNISESLAEYMGSFEYSAVVQLVIEFLEASTVSDSRMKDWPIYEEE